ncbi:hypothetical protein PG997_015120 [Apiospora hydei]|uniref:Uncharacterized protein n=1 Tax=Apiospora hydei TaxID=1337664 RepID=A0ABR1UVS3_9PEZI
MGRYTGLDRIIESRVHRAVLLRRLTPRLDGLTPALEVELDSALEACFGGVTASDWTVFTPHDCLNYIAARLSLYALVGPKFCRDPAWIGLSIEYPKHLTLTVVALRLFPTRTHPVISRCIPSFWKCQGLFKFSEEYLGPYITELLAKHDSGSWNPGEKPEEDSLLHWLVGMAKGADRNAETIAHIEVFMTMAAIQGGVRTSTTSYPKLDSVLRESQRASPPMILAMKRLFLQPYTFSTGFHAPAGTFVCMPACAEPEDGGVENASSSHGSTTAFDGLRSFRASLPTQAVNVSSSGTDSASKQPLFTSPSPDILSFGFGKGACPGRFIASRALKIVLVKLLTEYEFKAIPVTNPGDGFTLLHAATNAGQRYILNLLIKYRANLDAVSEAGYTALMLATAGRRSYIMADLIEAGANPDGDPRTPQFPSCLHIAAAHDDQGDMGPLHMLLVRGARLNVKEAEGRTPLHIAVKNGHLQAAKALIAFGADYGIADKQKQTAQDYAAELSEQSAALLEDTVSYWGKSRKSRATRSSFAKMTSQRTNWRGQFNGMSYNGLLGAPNGQFDWVHVLSQASGLELSRSAYEGASDRPGVPREFRKDWRFAIWHGDTLLEYALSISLESLANREDLLLGHMIHRVKYGISLEPAKVMGRLIELGASPNVVLPIRENKGTEPPNGPFPEGVIVLHGHSFTPLHVAVSRFAPEETVELFLDRGAEIEARTDEGLTPLLLAAQRGNHIVAKVLIGRGACVDARALDGRSVEDILIGPPIDYPGSPDSMRGRKRLKSV